LLLALLVCCLQVGPERVTSAYIELVAGPHDERAPGHLIEPGCIGHHQWDYPGLVGVKTTLLEQTESSATVEGRITFTPVAADGSSFRMLETRRVDLTRVDGLWRVTCPPIGQQPATTGNDSGQAPRRATHSFDLMPRLRN
jgi:hypothetical protein